MSCVELRVLANLLCENINTNETHSQQKTMNMTGYIRITAH